MKPLFAYWKMPCLPLVAVDNCSMILKIITTQQLFHYNDRFRCFQTGHADSIWQLLSHLLVTSFFFSSSFWHLNQNLTIIKFYLIQYYTMRHYSDWETILGIYYCFMNCFVQFLSVLSSCQKIVIIKGALLNFPVFDFPL